MIKSDDDRIMASVRVWEMLKPSGNGCDDYDDCHECFEEPSNPKHRSKACKNCKVCNPFEADAPSYLDENNTKQDISTMNNRKRVIIELSWPITVPYGKRSKRQFVYEFYKQNG